MNRTLIGMIRKVCVDQHSKWVEALPLLEFAYNNSSHSITRVSPFRAVQGSDPIVPASLLLPVATDHPQPRIYADQTHSRLQAIWATIKENEEKQSRQVEERENRSRGVVGRIQAGDEVLCRRF